MHHKVLTNMALILAHIKYFPLKIIQAKVLNMDVI